MKNRLLRLTTALVVTWAGWSLVSIPATGQEGAKPKPTSYGGCPAEILAFHACAQEKAKTFNPPRTPDGVPDLQGYWRDQLTHGFSVEGVDESEPEARNKVQPWPIGPGMIVAPARQKDPVSAVGGQDRQKRRELRKVHRPNLELSSVQSAPRCAGVALSSAPAATGRRHRLVAHGGGPRLSRHPYGRASASRKGRQAVEGRRCWPLGGQHAGRRRDQFQRLHLARRLGEFLFRRGACGRPLDD